MWRFLRSGGFLAIDHPRRAEAVGHHAERVTPWRDLERLQAGDNDVVQEPTEQPYGVRDCAFRDPAGNLIRIQQLR